MNDVLIRQFDDRIETSEVDTIPDVHRGPA